MITAVDVGATKTLVAQFNDAGEPVNHIRFETPSIVSDWVHSLNRALAGLNDVSALSIGLPGQISDDGETVLYCGNLPQWQHAPLKQMLQREHNCPVTLENDAAMAALSEINSLQPVPRLGYYLSLGTGVGGAIIVHGKLIPGLNRSEAGHMMLKTDTGWVEWEDIASGRAIVHQFHTLAKDLDQPEQWQWIAENIAQGLSPIIATILPQVIVVGGGVGRYFEKFHGLLAEKLHRRLPPYIKVPQLRAAQRADDSVLYGCYYHAIHTHNI
jgi:glucokinase